MCWVVNSCRLGQTLQRLAELCTKMRPETPLHLTGPSDTSGQAVVPSLQLGKSRQATEEKTVPG